MATKDQARERRIVGQSDTNLFGGSFTPFRDLWQSVAGDLGITTKRMRNDALATAAEEEAIWRDASANVTKELEAARDGNTNPDDLAQLRTLETQLDLAERLRQSSNPKLADAGIALLGKVTDAQRAFGETQETQRIARETQQATIQREIGTEAWSRMQSVADDLRTESTPFLGQKEAWGRIKAAASEPGEAGDYALLYAVHKMLDPASTVLASEFQNSQNLAGVPEILVTARNQLRNGERLTPERRAEFVQMAETQYRQSSEQQSERNARYLERARAGGVPDKYLDTLAIPVFSPGDSPTDFQSAADLAELERERNPAPPQDPQTDTGARMAGDSVRAGVRDAGSKLVDFLAGLMDAKPPRAPASSSSAPASSSSAPAPRYQPNGTRRGVYVPPSMRRPVN